MPKQLSWAFAQRVLRTNPFVAIVLLLILVTIVITVARAGESWASQRDLVMADPDALGNKPSLTSLALHQGRTVYAARCATCHGNAGQPDRGAGVPDLTDQDYLYGEGRVSEIEEIVRHGIRAGDKRGRNFAFMPAYATARPYAAEPIPPLSPTEIHDVMQWMRSRSGRVSDPTASQRGEALYLGKAGCYDCHGGDAKGDPSIGATNLLDNIWLYGDGSPQSIAESIEKGRKGYSPAYKNLLSAADIRAVSVYVSSLSARRQMASLKR